MAEQRPLTWELVLTGLIIIGLVCAGCFLTAPRWAHLLPTLPARAARDPSPTAAPTFTAIPTPTGETILDTPTPTLTPLPVPVLTFGTARPVPLIPIPTPTPSFTATPIPMPTSTALILFAPTWPVVNPTYTPWIGPTATTRGGSSSSSSGSDEEDEEVEDDNDDADDNDDDIGSGTCCRVCKIGKACGDTCIDKENQCTVGAGCACNFSQP